MPHITAPEIALIAFAVAIFILIYWVGSNQSRQYKKDRDNAVVYDQRTQELLERQTAALERIAIALEKR